MGTLEKRRTRVRSRLALVAAVGVAIVASIVAPLCIGLALGAVFPAGTVGWAVIFGLFAPSLLFPVGHALVHRFFAGDWPGWLEDRRRALELLAFMIWTGVLLVATLARVVPPGPASLVWPAGILAFAAARRWLG